MSSTRSKRLAKARKTRSKISHELARVETGELPIRTLLSDGHTVLDRCRIDPLLRRAPHFGPTGVKKALQGARIWPTIRLGDLTEEDRKRLLVHLPPRVR